MDINGDKVELATFAKDVDGALEAAGVQVSEEDIAAWCRENMAVYKVPRIVQFLDALPKSGSGKVMWRTLQEAEPKG